MLRCLCIGMITSVFAIVPLPAKAQEASEEDIDEKTAQSCMGARALIDFERGHPAWFCEDFYRQKGQNPL